jgi:hypothetical protein
MEEEWKDIANFEGLYQVSNLGRVKSLPKVGSGGHNGITLSQSKDKDGYLLVYLYANRKKVACKVHRLVAKAFIPNPNNFPQVNHKDEVKDNNSYGEGNINRANSKRVPILQLDMNDNIVREFNSAKEAESTLGFNSSNITNCCKGKYKSMYGYKWKYKQ